MIWPMWIPIVVALMAATAISFNAILGFLFLILGALVVCWWLIVMLVVAGLAVWRRAWRRAASLVAILVCAGPLMAVSMIAGDYLHFLLALPYYAIEIAAAGADSKPIYFHWPSAGLVPSYERNLVYDSSDELASHAGKPEPWKSEPAVTRTVRHFVGHFYLVEDFF
jgi:hypothetical protein